MHLKLLPLSGGFLGVDIFFALSGFLLSRNLIREYETHIILGEKDKYFSLLNFYARRFFRIFPAALFVASCTLLVIFFFASQEVARRSIVDYFFALLFIINFRLIQQQTDYFASTDLISYFQHYWSLASEEQFYILLPISLLWALKLHGLKFRQKHLSWQSRINYLVVTFTICSLVSSFLLQQVNPVMNYFLFTSRIWEFGIGILFAVNQTSISRVINRHVFVIRLVTYFLIWISFVFVTPGSPYLLFVTLLLIIFVSACLASSETDGSTSKLSELLVPLRAVLRRTGDVSYSLYLWHWPVILISGLFLPSLVDSKVWTVFLLAVTYLLSFITYKFIEQRFRGRKLNKKTKSAFKRIFQNMKHDVKTSSSFRKVVVGIILLTMALNLGYLHKTSSDHWDNVARQTEQTLPERLDSNFNVEADPESQDFEDFLKQSISDALLKTNVTEAEEVYISNLIEDRNNLWSKSCEAPMSLGFAACTDQNTEAPKKIVFVGDSYVVPFYSLIPQILGKSWEGQNMYFGQCTFASVIPLVNGAQFDKCTKHRSLMLQYLKTTPPDAVFIAENWNTPVNGVDDGDENKRVSLLAEGLRTSLQKLAPSTKIYYFGTPPDADSLPSCITRDGAIKSQCISSPSSSGKSRSIQSQIIREAGGTYIDPVPMLCANLACPPIIAGIPVSYDGSHLNLQYLNKVKDYFKSFFSKEL